MYADRYTSRRGLNPGGLAFALGASGVLLFGLSLTAPHFVRDVDGPFTIKSIPIDSPPPPKLEPTPQPHTKDMHPKVAPPREPIDTSKSVLPTTPSGPIAPYIEPPLLPPVTAGSGDVGPIVTPHEPVIAVPQLDRRYIDAFQPNYPSDERLAGRAGRVVVRVLIGTDGRVKQVEQVSAASSAFFEATRKRALEKWRFRPGTRDGVATEAWQTISVRFVLSEE